MSSPAELKEIGQAVLTCQQCGRLNYHFRQCRKAFPDYHNKPVEPYGDSQAALVIVGLAPGLHGANRTGRPFTGDYCGELLYSSLHRFGFASQAESLHRQDGLQLKNCWLTNAVKCLPPNNKPELTEIKACNDFLKQEIIELKPKIILALGTVAHDAVLRAATARKKDYLFAHGADYQLEFPGLVHNLRLVSSYHVSRYNTQTRRLTEAMFHEVLAGIADYLAVPQTISIRRHV